MTVYWKRESGIKGTTQLDHELSFDGAGEKKSIKIATRNIIMNYRKGK
jgi:hypothetical protein